MIEILKSQTFTNFEAIIIDDCSTDDTLDILQKHTKGDKRFRIFANKKNRGNAVKNKQFGLSKAKGEYYFYMSQDDLIDTDLFETLINTANSVKGGVDAVVPNMLYYSEDKTKDRGIFPPDHNYNLQLTGKEAFELCLYWKIHGFYLRKTSLMKKIGFDTSIFTGDEVTSRIYLYYCNKIAFVNSNFYYRTDNPNAITKSNDIKILDYVTAQLKLADFMIKKSFEKDFIKKWLKETFELLKKQRNILKEYYKIKEKKCFPKEFKAGLKKIRILFLLTLLKFRDLSLLFDILRYTHIRKRVADYD